MVSILSITTNFLQNYEIILKHLHSLNVSFVSILQIHKPKLGKLDWMAISRRNYFITKIYD
jgi:hypothetical protein